MQRTFLALAAGLGLAASPSVAMTFNEIDLNGDGALNVSEFAAAYPSAEVAYFNFYDRDRDGVATIDEVRAASRLLKEGLTIQEMDLDGDGELEQEEVEHVFSAGAQAALSKFDDDGDGDVTLNEVRASDDPVGERGRGAENRSRGEERSTAARARGKLNGAASDEGRTARVDRGKSGGRDNRGQEKADRAQGKSD